MSTRGAWVRRAGGGLCFAALALAAPQGFGSGLGPVGIGLVVAFLIISLSIHEAAHAWVAWKRGDPTAHDLGRITLNPIPHIDPVMTILMPALLLFMSNGAFTFGGAKPVPVNAMRLHHPLRDMMLVAIAGPLSNFLLAVLFAAAYWIAIGHGLYPDAASSISERQRQLLPLVLHTSVMMNVALAIFNLIPIPPLDGSRVMTWLLPPSLRQGYVQLETFGMLIIIVLISFVPQFNALLQGAVVDVFRWVHSLTSFLG